MRIFLDTANIQQIKDAVKLGVISGVTTNPSLVSKEDGAYRDLIVKICGLVPGPVSAEVLGETAADMVKEARDIITWAPNIAVKIPATAAGLEATSILSKDGVKVNFTLCFSLNQALLAALAGAAYVSPFVGRLDDAGHDGMALVKEIVEVYDHYKLGTQVIAASIRHTRHCVVAAQVGAHIATIPYAVLTQMLKHPLTDVGVVRFREDFKATLKS
ncbi:MAG: fructose-6-phosphate aldolase [Dehalococcoidia bacterium]|nr:MAG: fructose-6-phosphate aldolase [Dehalococcoidia bacterium]